MASPIRDEWRSDDGSVRLILGDALDVLPTLDPGTVEACVFDPPYAISGGGASIAGKGTEEAFDLQFYEAWLRDLIEAVYPVMSMAGAMWWTSDWRGAVAAERALCRIGGWKQKPRLAAVGVWDRGGLGMGYVLRKTYEMFCVAVFPEWNRTSTDTPDVWRIKWTPGDRNTGHQAQKPVELFDRALELLGGAVVADPFLGSGTCAVAAINRGLRFVGIEKDEEYYTVAVSRVREALERLRFLEPESARPQQLELLDAGDVSVSVDCPG